MKRFLNFINKLRNESGSALVIVTISMVAMLGFTALVIDGGRLYYEKSRLQKALDAAVLAGAQGLFVNEVHAESIAKNISVNNGYSLLDEDFETIVNNYIKVEKTVTVPMTFAKVLNIETVDVSASAKAKVAPIISASGIAPIAVEKSEISDAIIKINSGTYTGTDLLCTKKKQSTETESDTNSNGNGNGNNSGNGNGNGNNSGQHSPGNCGFLSFDGRGAAELRDALLNGATYSVGQRYVMTEPGGINQAKSAIQTLITSDQAEGRTYCANPDTADNSCKRVITIVVIDTWSNTNGRDEVEIVNFASFWLESFDDQGSDKALKGRFIKTISPGEVTDSTGGGTGENLVYGVKLTE
jgi:hypothetical protein